MTTMSPGPALSAGASVSVLCCKSAPPSAPRCKQRNTVCRTHQDRREPDWRTGHTGHTRRADDLMCTTPRQLAAPRPANASLLL
mmetsp:Transcript_24007/g.64957  ORF Transcript_24007/g.64957 Transcript_24007/m.64957 type:complete len:84 (-) Transcript_24007:624-875(-)